MRPHTYEGAKRMGRALQREFDTLGADVRLSVCQRAVAAGAGFASLDDLRGRLAWEGARDWSPARAAEALGSQPGSIPSADVADALAGLRRRFAHWA